MIITNIQLIQLLEFQLKHLKQIVCTHSIWMLVVILRVFTLNIKIIERIHANLRPTQCTNKYCIIYLAFTIRHFCKIPILIKCDYMEI